MKLYLVRHGESISNALRIAQDHISELSETGKAQAKTVANRLKNIGAEIILSSPYIRARQTAEILQKKIKTEIVFTDLLREMRRPSETIGKPYDDPLMRKIRIQMAKHTFDPAWHYSDEDNFYDLKTRGKECLLYIAKRQEEKILAVTHGIFTRIIIGNIIFGDSFSSEMYDCMTQNMRSQNTGISICERSDTGKWTLLSWNDHAHLG